MPLTDKLKPTYWTIAVHQHLDYGREFFIKLQNCKNGFHYAHLLCGLCFKTGKDAEKEILRKLKITHGIYTRIDGKVEMGIPAPRYGKGCKQIKNKGL